MDSPTPKRRRSARTAASDRGAGPAKSRTRSEELLHCLEGEILSGTIPPGTRLDEQTLAKRFEVSRTPVREVLWHLASSGLVQMRPHHGAVVRQFTLAELVEMFQVMAELEGLSARLAARRITPEERQKLRASHEACAAAVQARDETGFFDENNVFHDIILNASRNTFLLNQQRDLRRLLNPYRRYVTRQSGRMEKSVAEHEAVLDAIERGDAAAAGDTMRFHVNMLGEEAGDFIAVLSGIGSVMMPPAEPAAAEVRPPRGRRRAAAGKASDAADPA
jgi:DNA-binding GntR family transcriptional regulator